MEQNNETNKEIEILFAEKEVEINGETIAVKPYSWVMGIQAIHPLSVIVKVFTDHIGAVQAAYQGYVNLKIKLAKEQQELPEGEEVDIPIEAFIALAEPILESIQPDELERVTAALTKLMLYSIDKPRQYIESLAPQDAITLIVAVYEANKYFFGKRLAKTEQPSEKTTKQ